MPIRKSVRRGDSLWSLSNRYLGSGVRYPEILNFHNQEAARYGLRIIDNEDLIFVGETILIQPRSKQPAPSPRPMAKGNQWPIPPNVKPTYVIGRDTPPIDYVTAYGDYTIHTEMSGEIGIENITPGHSKYVHNFELWMSKSPEQARSKLRSVYDPAIAALTAKPEVVFESGRVKIQAPISAKANLGPYSVEVQAVSPLQMTGMIKPQTISGTFDLGRYRYRYTADVGFNVDVIWHQKPKGKPELVKATEPVQKVELVEKPTAHTTKWDQTVAQEGFVMALVTIMLYAANRAAEVWAIKGMKPLIMPPFKHKIDCHNYNRNA